MADDRVPPEPDEGGEDPVEELTPEQRAANASWERSAGRKRRLGKPVPPMPFPPPEERQEAPEQPDVDFSIRPGKQIGDPAEGGMSFIDRTNEPAPTAEPPPPEPLPEPPPKPDDKRGQYPREPEPAPGGADPFNDAPDPEPDKGTPAPIEPFDPNAPEQPWAPRPQPEPPGVGPQEEAGETSADGGTDGIGELTAIVADGVEKLDEIKELLEEIKDLLPNVGGLA